MDFQNLSTFIQVAEMNSFTKAANKLGFSQPTVSLQIKQLETEMGVKLFDRIGHTVTLTDAGRDALVYAQNICRLSDEMVQGANDRYEARGIIKIAIPDSLCTPLIVSRFDQFRKRYPHVSLEITTAGTGEMYRLLDHNEVDIVCTLDSPIYDNNYIIVNEEKVLVHFVVSADHPLAAKNKLTIKDLMDESFLLTERGMSYRRLMDEQLAKMTLEITPVLEIGGADLLCRLVEENQGISFLPDFATESSVKAGRIKRLDVKGFNIEVRKQIFYRRDKWVSLQMKAIIDHLSEIIL